MLSNLTEQLFSNWHPMRWVALLFGLALGYNWLVHNASLSGALSIFFLFQAVTNTGCRPGSAHPGQQLQMSQLTMWSMKRLSKGVKL